MVALADWIQGRVRGLYKVLAASVELPERPKINFSGAGVTVTDNGPLNRTDVAITSGGATVQSEGTPLTTRPAYNFQGDGVTAIDNSGATRTDITIAGTWKTIEPTGSDDTAFIVAQSAAHDFLELKGAFSVSTTAAIGASGTTIRFRRGAKITIASGRTLTFNAAIDAPDDQQLFAGAGVVVFTSMTPYVSAKWLGATGDGTTDDGPALAIAAVACKTMRLPPGTYKIANDTTLGAVGRMLDIESGALLKPASGKTATLNCPHNAADEQRFVDRSAGGAVVFGPSGPKRATPEHFGATRDSSTHDEAAIQAAHDAMATYGGDLALLGYPGYALGAGLVLKTGVNIRTQGRESTILYPKTSMHAMSWYRPTEGDPQQKRTRIEPMQVAFYNINNTVTNGKNSNVGIDLSNVNWAVIDEPYFLFSGTSSQGGTGLLFTGHADSGPYFNEAHKVLFFGIAGANCIGAHFASGGTGAANANGVDFQSIENMAHAVKFGNAVENLVIITEMETLDADSAYLVFGDEPSGPSGTIGNRVIVNYYETDAVTAYLIRYGSATSSNDRNVVEAIDNGPFPGSGAIVDPGGSGMGTNAIMLNGHEYLGDLSVRTTPTGSKGTLSTADLSADRVLRLPNAAAELQARDVSPAQIVATTGTVTAFNTLPTFPGQLIYLDSSLTLTGNLTIEVPPVAGLAFGINNLATLAGHTVSVKATGGSAIAVYPGSCQFYVDHDGVTLVRRQITTLDTGSNLFEVTPTRIQLSGSVLWEDDAGNLRGQWVIASLLELTQFDNFVMQSKSGGQIGLACDQVDIDTQSLTLGGYLKAPSQDHLEIGAVTETNLKIGNNSLIKVDTTGIGEFGHATAGQQSDYGALSDGTGGSTSGGLVDVTTGGLADPAKINDNFARIDAKLDAIRAVLRAHGRMA